MGHCWLQGYDWKALILATPLFFGVCHVHHGWNMVHMYGLSRQVVAIVLLQLLYTTVFGWYATYVYLATGSILAAVWVHSLCNVFGLPPFHQMNRLSLMACAAGVALFAALLPRLVKLAPPDALWWQHNLTHAAQL